MLTVKQITLSCLSSSLILILYALVCFTLSYQLLLIITIFLSSMSVREWATNSKFFSGNIYHKGDMRVFSSLYSKVLVKNGFLGGLSCYSDSQKGKIHLKTCL